VFPYFQIFCTSSIHILLFEMFVWDLDNGADALGSASSCWKARDGLKFPAFLCMRSSSLLACSKWSFLYSFCSRWYSLFDGWCFRSVMLSWMKLVTFWKKFNPKEGTWLLCCCLIFACGLIRRCSALFCGGCCDEESYLFVFLWFMDVKSIRLLCCLSIIIFTLSRPRVRCYFS